MAVPRNRTSNARKNSRRAHHAKKPKQFSKCSNCSAACLPHRVCTSCGFYAGKSVVN
ncbi:MAG: 50S ribosomal protein L32 [Rhabdochlamydiaceae bacterium]